MRSVFSREFHQGRSLLAFSALLGGLVPAGYVALSHTPSYRFYAVGQSDLAAIFGKLILLLPFVVALFAGAGLFAAERDRGTLPLLFALPFSRRRIWLAKALAGLALTGMGAAIIIGLSAMMLPQAARTVPIAAFLPDLCLGLIFVFAVALFTSALTSSVIAAVVTALLLGWIMAFGVVYVWGALGGMLLAYSPLLDIALWGLAFAAVLLGTSVLVISRGELLQSRRKHLLAFPALLAGLLVSVFLISGIARWATRYQRDRVEVVRPLRATPGSPVLMLSTQADPVPLKRDGYGRGWSPRLTGHESNMIGNISRGPLYRSTYTVAIDLKSGRELLVLRHADYLDPLSATCSPDGRYAAVLTGPGSITWGRPDTGLNPRRSIRIYDLWHGTQLFAGTPKAADVKISGFMCNPQWSSSGRYLAFSAASRTSDGRLVHALYVMRRDGSGLRDLSVRAASNLWRPSWAWSPTRDVLHTCDDAGRVSRVPVDGQEPEVIWSQNEQDASRIHVLGLKPSPDGRWLALSLSREIATDAEKPSRITTVHAIPTDGGESCTIATLTPPANRPSTFCNTRLAWATGGNTLFLLASNAYDVSRLLRWHPGEAAAEPVDAELPYRVALAAVPGSPHALVYPWGGEHAPFLLDEEGAAQPVLSAAFAREHRFVGLDDTGRVLTRGWPNDRPAVFATDLDTGNSQRLYP